ncbi:MAG: carbohydrate-binding domain-containing protein, partial [Oscillospiraceae bacterium]|nr:carbohydrate-binding domain-containing protein [Oscillospiraceae bacterium]
MSFKHSILPLFLAASLSLSLLTGCGSAAASASGTSETGSTAALSAEAGDANQTQAQTNQNTQNDQTAAAETDASSDLTESDLFTSRDLSGEYDLGEAVQITLTGDGATASGTGVTVEGSTVTITAEGVYVLSGTLADGQIIVDAGDSDKVQLVLDGADISCSSSAAIYVKQADKVFLTLAEGSENSVSTTGDFVQTDDNNVDGAIFSKDDLVINGTGSLTVTDPYGNGVVSKDDLKIIGGTLTVSASNHALEGKDSVRIADGIITLTAGQDGIHSDNTEDEGKGYVAVLGGTLTITAGDDGIHASGALSISGGTVDVLRSYEGLEGMTIEISGGEITVVASDDGLNAAGGNDTASGQNDFFNEFAAQEGVYINITGGKLTVNSEGDGLDSNGDLYVSGGEIIVYGPLNSANGAIDHNGSASITGGTLIALSCSGMEEGFESTSTQGTIAVTLSSTQNGTLTLADSAGNVLLTCEPEKNYSVVQLSCPGLTEGETYTLTTGAESTTITMD